jgi:uncharacterized DUF497 family protein
VAIDPIIDQGEQRSARCVFAAFFEPEWYKCYIQTRFEDDRSKSRAVKRKHGVSLKQAQEIFDQAYLIDQKNDDPEQFRAIGWCGGRLCSVVFEIRHDAGGEYYHLVIAWRATQEEERSYAENV